MNIEIVMDRCLASEHPPEGPLDMECGDTILCVRIAGHAVCIYCVNLAALVAIEEARESRRTSLDLNVRADEKRWSGLDTFDEFIDHLGWAWGIRAERLEHRENVEAALQAAAAIVAS